MFLNVLNVLQDSHALANCNPNWLAQAGADMFVAGSAILKNPRTQDAYAATIKSMRDSLATVKR